MYAAIKPICPGRKEKAQKLVEKLLQKHLEPLIVVAHETPGITNHLFFRGPLYQRPDLARSAPARRPLTARSGLATPRQAASVATVCIAAFTWGNCGTVFCS
jgi:hypothetical protein